MLPALQLNPMPGERQTFTRRPEWVQPLESLWSILSKWQFVNRLPYSTIANAILARSAETSSQGVDLRSLDQFRLDALAEHSGVSPNTLASAACSPSANSRMIEFASQYLRYCAACMADGFHAVLFQFHPIHFCPIHHLPLRDTCTSCRNKIPYRIDAGFAAHPFACPHCAHRLLPDPTALARQAHAALSHDAIISWQLFLATYVFWYAEGRQTWRDDSGRFLDREKTPSNHSVARRFDFIGALQSKLNKPPPLPILKMNMELLAGMAPESMSTAIIAAPGFSRRYWRRFHTRRFLSLCRRYSHFCDRLQQLNLPRQREATLWWRRSWEGAISRQCDETTTFTDPPFGIAEWACFSVLPNRMLKRAVIEQQIGLRLEQDLRSTWHAWYSVIVHLNNRSCRDLHPYLVPPRACWLTSPTFDPGSSALGFI